VAVVAVPRQSSPGGAEGGGLHVLGPAGREREVDLAEGGGGDGTPLQPLRLRDLPEQRRDEVGDLRRETVGDIGPRRGEDRQHPRGGPRVSRPGTSSHA
jgi:hypothetical protein